MSQIETTPADEIHNPQHKLDLSWVRIGATAHNGMIPAGRNAGMLRIQCLLLCLLTATSTCRAADWFVATNGSGNGSLTSPWSLQFVLTNHPTGGTSVAVHPGDIVWLRGGVYVPPGTNSASNNDPGWYLDGTAICGSPSGPITFASYSNEWAAIDQWWRGWYPSGQQNQGYVTFSNLEFFDSLKGNHQPIGVRGDGPWGEFGFQNCYHFQLVNCLLHDLDNVFDSADASVRGCILWHNALPTELGHVFYTSCPYIYGNISGWHVGSFIQHTTVGNTLVQSNILFGAGQTVGGGPADISADTGGYSVIYNHFYNYYSQNGGGGGSAPNNIVALGTNGIVNSNVIVGPYPVVWGPNALLLNQSFAGNEVYMNAPFSGTATIQWAPNPPSSNFDYNVYYSARTVDFYCALASTFSQWQANYPAFDVHSSAYSYTAPPDSVYVIPNQDAPKRAHIAVYNFGLSNSVSVNLSGILNAGDTYQLISAQDPDGYGQGQIKSYSIGGTNVYYTAGLYPIQVGTYNGTSISVPMTNLTVANVLYGTNYTSAVAGHRPGVYLTNPPPLESPTFGAFIVIGSAPAPPASPTGLRGVPSDQ